MIRSLAEDRELARKAKDFKKSDELRKIINENDYDIEDTDSGFEIIKK